LPAMRGGAMIGRMENKGESRSGTGGRESGGAHGTCGTNRTDRTYERLIPAHGGYRNLKSYQAAEIIYDATVLFCNRFIDRRSRTHDQMVQAARSGKQNIAEASQASATSKKTELKLTSVARASLEELLQDYQDFLRQRNLPAWRKDDPRAQAIRRTAYKSYRSYESYRSYVEESSPEVAANAVICLVHQANYLLDQQLRSLERQFLAEGGFTERLYQARSRHRSNGERDRTNGTHRTYERRKQ
jgi:restriction system protein